MMELNHLLPGVGRMSLPFDQSGECRRVDSHHQVKRLLRAPCLLLHHVGVIAEVGVAPAPISGYGPAAALLLPVPQLSG